MNQWIRQPGRASGESLYRRSPSWALIVGLSIALPTPGWTADTRSGQQIYNTHCFSCHGPGGRPSAPGAPNFSRHQGLMQSDVTLYETIRRGQRAMPGYRGVLSNQDILDVISYIRTF